MMVDFAFLNADVTGEIIASALTNIVGDENDLILSAVSTKFYRDECMAFSDDVFMGDSYECAAFRLIQELGYDVVPAFDDFNEDIQLKSLFFDYYRRIYGEDVLAVVSQFRTYRVFQHIDQFIDIFGGEDPANGISDIHSYIWNRMC